MLSRKSFLLLAVYLLIISNVSMAVMCARFSRVSAGEDHTLVLMDDNTLWACGGKSSNCYQLGLDGAYNVLSLEQVFGENGVGFLQNVVAFDAGWYHSLAADANGTLWSWGTDNYGQLGNGSSEGNWDVPEKVHGVNDVGYLSDTVDIVYVSAGRSGMHSLAVDSNGYVYAWGLNGNGQCGIGSTGGNLQIPYLVLDDDANTTGYLGNIATIIKADAGVTHSLALDDDGYVWEWGGNNGSSYPQKVPGVGGTGDLSNIVGISTCEHSLAVDSNGFVYEWKNGNPYKVPGGEMGTTYLEDIVEVGAGFNYSMARTSEASGGYVLYWDYDGDPAYPAYVEDGDMGTESGLLEGIISIGAGFEKYHMLAICENGYGWEWGKNGYGKLGVGDDDDRDEPTQMLCAEVSSSIYLTKTSEILGDEPNCVRPFVGLGGEDNYLVYEICYGNPITNTSDPNYYGSVYDVNIIDHLPIEVNEPNNISGGGVYDSNAHTITWAIGELAPGDSNCFTVTTKVNRYARPGGEISNFVEMTAEYYYSYATDTVPVCNWGHELIYVDEDANGFENGTRWEDAYTTLREAFTGAQNIGSEITAIWVAGGTYEPVESTEIDGYKGYSFELLEDVGLIGHFAGTEDYVFERDLSDANNETILEGQIGSSAEKAVEYVLKAEDINDCLIDGFTIRGSYRGSYNGAGLYLDNTDASIVNCKFVDNCDSGIEVVNSSETEIHNSIFSNNNTRGIEAYSNSSINLSYCSFDGNDNTDYGFKLDSAVVNVENCLFKNHDIDGIRAENSNIAINRSIFSNNGGGGVYAFGNSDLTLNSSIIKNNGSWGGIAVDGEAESVITNNWIHNNADGPGIDLFYSNQTHVIRNNTIYGNKYGIRTDSSNPAITNCIIYGNNYGDFRGTFSDVDYCCLEDSHMGTCNIVADPCFANVALDSNDLHISVNSFCKDAGDSNSCGSDEKDIDGEGRVKYGRVDIGADEYYDSKADFDNDDFVNFVDYAMLAAVWDMNSDDAGYDDDVDLYDDNEIDVEDLGLLAEDWLWQKASSESWMLRSCGGVGAERMLALDSLSLKSLDSSIIVKASPAIDLMLSTVSESMQKCSEALAFKTQKFYDIRPANTISAKTALLDSRENIRGMLELLDMAWKEGDFAKMITREEYEDLIAEVVKSMR